MRQLAAAAAVSLAAVLAAGCSDNQATGTAAADRAAAVAAGHAAEWRTVTLSVPGMDCPMCPITVRRALTGVYGVAEAEASLRTKQAVVRFDPARTDVNALIAATTRAGFPSSVKE